MDVYSCAIIVPARVNRYPPIPLYIFPHGWRAQRRVFMRIISEPTVRNILLRAYLSYICFHIVRDGQWNTIIMRSYISSTSAQYRLYRPTLFRESEIT